MKTYYMGADLNAAEKIVGWNNQPSEYQELIDQYKARGGRVTVCPTGARSTMTPIPAYNISQEERRPTIDGNTTSGYALMDQIDRERNKAFDPDTYFDGKDNS